MVKSIVKVIRETACTHRQLWVKRAGSSQAPVALSCNPSYSGGRDQEHGLKTAQLDNSSEPLLKNPIT
jgi:hypothetical protein